MTVRDLRRAAVAALIPLYGRGEAEWMTRLTLESVTGWSRVDLLVDAGKELGEVRVEAVKNIVDRLLKHEPLQYILGYEDFMGLKIKVSPSVLIPRPETQELVNIIIDREAKASDLSVLDAGTGSGAIAVALSRNLRFARVTAIDNSDAALEVARSNAERLRTPVTFVNADMLSLASLPGEPFDIIVSNPPYVLDSERAEMSANVLGHEPSVALFVPDSDPFRFYLALARYAAAGGLKPDGRLYFECNPLTIGVLPSQLEADFDEVEAIRDSFGRKRFIIASLRS
jgi:protein-(glutamine-N5) methyltransferase, release factor-specific